jgi:hypothetical protein
MSEEAVPQAPSEDPSEAEVDESEDAPVFEKTEPDPHQSRTSDSMLANSMAEDFSQRLLAGEDISIVPQEHAPGVVRYLTRYRDSQIEETNVDEAERSDNLIVALAQRKSTSQTQYVRDTRDSRLADRLEAAQERFALVQDRFETVHDAILDKNASQIRQLEEKHQKEIADFEALWSTPVKTRPYTRASQQLIEVRTRSVLLMKARRFDDHRLIERAAEEMGRDEAADRHWRMEQEFDAQLKLLKARQAEEMQRQKVSNESRICAFTRSRERAVSAAKQRVANLENEMITLEESDKMRNEPRYDPEAIVPPSRTGKRSGLDMNAICQLKLPPLNVKARTQTTKSTPVKKKPG